MAQLCGFGNSSNLKFIVHPKTIVGANFDHIAKNMWIFYHFVEVSQFVYHLEKEMMIDDCIIIVKVFARAQTNPKKTT